MSLGEDSEREGAEDSSGTEKPLPAPVVRRLLKRWYEPVLVLVLAVPLRVVALGSLPHNLADEILASVDLHSILTEGLQLDRQPPGLLAHIVPAVDGRTLVSFIGDRVTDIRIASVLFGLGSVLVAFRLGGQLFGRRAGFAAAVALALMPWHIYFSRLSLPQSGYLFFSMATLSYTLTALDRMSILEGILATLFAASSIYIYPAAIFGTPLLLFTVLAARHREIVVFGATRALWLFALFCLLMSPYIIAHRSPETPGVAVQQAVAEEKLLWNHGLPPADVAGRFARNWVSYLSPSLLFTQGDPNVRHSDNRMGAVGWATGALAVLGVVVAVARPRKESLLLVAWLVLFPVADAVTYQDANANSARGILGSALWALAAGVGAVTLLNGLRGRARHVAIAALFFAVAAQTVVFARGYFGGYRTRSAPAFEAGYEKVYDVLKSRGLQDVPITVHAGTQRGIVLNYFARYRLNIAQEMSSCEPLGSSAASGGIVPHVFVIRKDFDSRFFPDCSEGDVVERDVSELESRHGAANVDVLAEFPPGGREAYRVAVVLVRPA